MTDKPRRNARWIWYSLPSSTGKVHDGAARAVLSNFWRTDLGQQLPEKPEAADATE